MTHITRRAFVLGGAAAGVGAALGAPAASAQGSRTRAASRRIPLIRQTLRAVIIGSGFGGGVTALRLAQAGVEVTVLERGLRWPTGPNAHTFPSAAHPDKRALWYGSDPVLFNKPVVLPPYAGLVEAVVGNNMTALCGCGVGGGSLIYQGMSLQPSREAFELVLPPALDYTQMDATYYPRVAQMLQLATAPEALYTSPNYYASRVFARHAAAAGFDVAEVPMPIDWTYALDELAGDMRPSYTNGNCSLGVNNGGKHSVDVTYLAQAEATGRCTVEVLHNVTDVAQSPSGAWTVAVDVTDSTGTVVAQKILTCKALIMSAGSLNTTRLLVAARAKGLIAGLPDGVGSGWGTNADRIYLWTDLAANFGPVQGGPVIFYSPQWDDAATANTVIQASFPPFGTDTRTTVMVGYGVSAARGAFAWDAAQGQAVLDWPADGDAPIQDLIATRVRSIAGSGSLLTDTNAVVPSTWHGLGGAAMGTVCDLEGRVLDNPGLYVIDGALIPGSTAACNPSLTIAAVAERALDRIVAEDLGTLI